MGQFGWDTCGGPVVISWNHGIRGESITVSFAILIQTMECGRSARRGGGDGPGKNRALGAENRAAPAAVSAE
ncbi:hypothetical protein MTP99_018298 [Tenebrio molitor]|nr:hypothetical protein MTP99_018298 [Tenebrio molitor]